MLILPSELVVGGPLTRANHRVAVRLAEPRFFGLGENRGCAVRGRVHFGRPMMALATEKKLGPVRHAVAQMVVAGTMVVQTPVQVRVPVPFRAPEPVGSSDAAGVQGGPEAQSHPARMDERVDPAVGAAGASADPVGAGRPDFLPS